jgi:2-dehydro-3-deoxyphosphogluconate aldolase/(4S)-4-hydroxy-2-oxoglutarate aldolase
MDKNRVLKEIEESGLLPVLRADSSEQAVAIADAIVAGGISVLEVTMTVPGAIDVIRTLVKQSSARRLI